MQLFLRTIITTALLSLTPISTSYSQDNKEPLALLLSAKSIRCKIESGYSTSFTEGKFKSDKDSFSSKEEDKFLTFTNINIKEGTALSVGNAGSDKTLLTATPAGLNFMSITVSGGLVTATISPNLNKEGKFFYTTSRHTYINFGKPINVPSQYYGFCEILELQ